jgi:PfaD family protein
MFGVRAKKLYEHYRNNAALEELSPSETARLEKEILGESVGQAWAKTASYWRQRDLREVQRAESDPKHKMALLFRSYLGQSSKWAISGDPARRMDYQIWCGPAMGAFNAWVRNSFLEPPENRSAAQVARNLMEGAAVVLRAQQLRSFGVSMPPSAFSFRPRPLE